MKEYESFENIKYDPLLLGEEVWAWNKLDGQNFRVKYLPKQKGFVTFGSRTQIIDETSESFGSAVKFFNDNLSDKLKEIILSNSKKGGVFNSVQEITFFFEWYGDNSFSGFHKENDEMHLALIDVNIYKKGYLEQKDFYKLFCEYDNNILETPDLIYRGKLTDEFVKSIQNNDWTKLDCQYPNVKEGVVCKRSTLMKGQRLPKVKIKTFWWLEKLTEMYPDRWKELE